MPPKSQITNFDSEKKITNFETSLNKDESPKWDITNLEVLLYQDTS